MEIKFLNSSFEIIYILDVFNSVMWIDRYWENGEIDIVVPPSIDLFENLSDTTYFKLDESEHLMVFEHAQIQTKIEEGTSVIIKGRSLESILDRRIVWLPTVLSGNLQDAIETLLLDSIILPGKPDRSIDNFVFEPSIDPAITALTIDTQIESGVFIYTAISEICKTKQIGFKIVLGPSNTFVFSLYAGTDRSYNQVDNTYIEFSSNLDNLINADYIQTNKFMKTVILVAGEQGVGNARATVEVTAPGGGLTGLDRREMFIAAGISKNLPGGGTLTDEEYLDQLESKGVEELAKNIFIESFDGEVDTTMWNYGDEYHMGDVLQISDEFGHSTPSRVIEMIYSQDSSGIKFYPTFTALGI